MTAQICEGARWRVYSARARDRKRPLIDSARRESAARKCFPLLAPPHTSPVSRPIQSPCLGCITHTPLLSLLPGLLPSVYPPKDASLYSASIQPYPACRLPSLPFPFEAPLAPRPSFISTHTVPHGSMRPNDKPDTLSLSLPGRLFYSFTVGYTPLRVSFVRTVLFEAPRFTNYPPSPNIPLTHARPLGASTASHHPLILSSRWPLFLGPALFPPTAARATTFLPTTPSSLLAVPFGAPCSSPRASTPPP